jgi:predicted helicase
MIDLKLFHDYIQLLQKELAAGDATEQTHRPALKSLIQSLSPGILATNEPKHIECGAPDFIVRKGVLTIGYIEAKDIDKSLDEAEKSDQLKRYRESLSNLILTDYLEFRWYVNGERRLSARLGTAVNGGKLKTDKEGFQNVAELLSGFLSRQAENVGKPKDLAVRMARLAHMIRNLIVNAFSNEAETGGLHTQLAAFRDNLIPDLSVAYFADMYAQTIAYGLFAARCAAPDNKDFTRQNAAYLLPKTNPFLRKLFNTIAGPDLDDRIAWLVDDLAQVLAQADMAAVLTDFGKHIGKADPVVHFYETFLKEYDEKIREMRGVYYTPEPVVSYIVRSIDHLLKTRFDKPLGLADEKTLILDPAVGTATFLYKVINEIYQATAAKGQQGMWNNYVAEKLLPRIFGFELLMAPYAVAHLKLGLLLQETGYQFQTDQRLGIYLTNTLEEAFEKSELLPGFNKYIVDEANEAAEIKKTKPIMVVLGNPPYSGVSANRGKWIGKLIDDYRQVDGKPLEEYKVWLQNDYVKFIRFGQWRIERTGQGILGFITDHSYLDSPTFRGMRQALINTFTEIYILDLHGDSRRRETAPDGGIDENVFDIQQGVAIALFVKEPGKTSATQIRHGDLWGSREEKYKTLFETDISSTIWSELQPESPFYIFAPRNKILLAEYGQCWKVTEIWPINSVGFMTGRDNFIIDASKDELLERLSTFFNTKLEVAELKTKLRINDYRRFRIEEIRKARSLDLKKVRQCLYRPFDLRYTYYDQYIIQEWQQRVMYHMLQPNIALIIGRAGQVTGTEPWDIIFSSSQIIDLNVFYRGGGQCFPLYLYPTEGEMQFQEGRRPNLNPDFIRDFSEKLGLQFIADGKGDLEQTFGPEDVFNYAYAVFHSPAYRTRYAEFLKTDFPRLPLTSNKDLFKALAAKGAALVSLHLMESPLLKPDRFITKYAIGGTNIVENVTCDEKAQRVYINKTQYFDGVPSEVWNFHVGGYQVCQKWLKDRKGRTLTYDDSQHYQKIIVALQETIRLMAEIDGVIPSWPIS